MIECCCIDEDGCGYYPSFSKLRRARKEHKCVECSEPIVVGQKYEHFKGYDSELQKWDEHKTCIPCTLIRRDFFPCGSYVGGMRDEIKECSGFDYVTGEEA